MFDNMRVVRGQILRVPLKFGADWIAAGSHDLIDQPMRLVNGMVRLIDKAGLSSAPPLSEAVTLFPRDCVDVKPLNALGPSLELGLGSATVADLGDSALVFRTKALTQALRAASFKVHERRRR